VNYIIHFLECYEAWKVDLQWVAAHDLEGSDLEFERMLHFKELHCEDCGSFFCEKKREVSRYNIIGKIIYVRSKFFYFILKKNLKIYLNLFV
jgi:hypothetical protein